MKENNKTKIWVYAVVLFTSAFIVLLFTAYSQIKLNKNLDDYKDQIHTEESEKNKYQQNFSSAQEMNEKLNGEIKKLQEENTKLVDEIESVKRELEEADTNFKKKRSAAAGYSKALTVYLSGNIVESAGLLKDVATSDLDGEALESYHVLVKKVNAEAGKILFDEGFSLYNKGKYAESTGKLLKSFEFAPVESFSDKCLYYLAYSEKKSGNSVTALEHMNKLVEKFPDSKYLKSAKRFIEREKK